MEYFQPLLGGADAQPNNNKNNENRINVNIAPSYGSLKNQSKIDNRDNNGMSVPQSPLPIVRLPPIPLRQRAYSSGDRSVSDVSIQSGRSGSGSSQRGRRSSSPAPGNHGNFGASRSPSSPLILMGPDRSDRHQNNVFRPHPLMKSESTSSSGYRANLNDGFRPSHLRQSSSGSVFSISSQESVTEAIKLLPDPRWGGGSGANRVRSFSSSSHFRHNSFSSFPEEGGCFDYGSLQGLSFANLAPHAGGKKKHRRSDSVCSIDHSVDPVTTNMSKSSMFKEVTTKGVVRMQLPKDQFRLLSDRDLEIGSVYKRVLVDNEDEYFQDYHITELDDLIPARTAECQCTCENCNRCHTRIKQLPPSHYVMAVKSDIFRRMFDEVSASKSMPCGLFFCGHHEDVSHPSVKIAVVLVSILFVAMLLATIYVSG